MKRKAKLILDVILLAILVTLFNKRLISMHYHEVAGLLLCVLAVVHIGINSKIITGMLLKFRKMTVQVKIGVIIDILLILCFLWIGISGILISHTLLTGISYPTMLMKTSHIFSGALSVLLIGVHIGLHIYRRKLPRAAAAILSVVILCGGLYGAVSSSELQWLSIPMQAAAMSGEGPAPGGEFPLPEHEEEHNLNYKAENRDGFGPGKGRGGMHGTGKGLGKGKAQTLSLQEKAKSIVMFLGMILSCAVITAWIAVPKKNKKQELDAGSC